jgi:hypothetical protein
MVTEWVDLRDNLPRFLAAIFTTAQVYRDNDQAMLPSYRERIVQIRLAANEGGLNLAMPLHTIRNVIGKGEAAGALLKSNFDFKQHFWIRFRVLARQLETGLEDMRRKIEEIGFRDQLSSPRAITGYAFAPYGGQSPEFEAWCHEVLSRLDALDAVLAGWTPFPQGGGDTSGPLFAAPKFPIPEAVLRVMPKV